MVDETREKILKYSWGEFLKTPFSLLFFFLIIAISYITYEYVSSAKEEKDIVEQKYHECVEHRVKDRDTYVELLREINISNTLKKTDSTR